MHHMLTPFRTYCLHMIHKTHSCSTASTQVSYHHHSSTYNVYITVVAVRVTENYISHSYRLLLISIFIESMGMLSHHCLSVYFLFFFHMCSGSWFVISTEMSRFFQWIFLNSSIKLHCFQAFKINNYHCKMFDFFVFSDRFECGKKSVPIPRLSYYEPSLIKTLANID